MRYFWAFLISLYQKYISPRKGFRCAYAALHGGDSCSAAVKKIILNRGVIGGWRGICMRFAQCSLAYQHIQKSRDKKDRRNKDKWYHYCDCSGCIPCKGKQDIPDMDCNLPCDCSL